MSAPAQRSFARGELAPELYAHTDQAQYAAGLRTCRNMIVRGGGGVTNRAGTAFIVSSKDSAVVARLLPFVLDATKITDTYLLEFGDRYIRFFQAGAQLTVSGVAAWVTTTPYAVGDLVSSGGVTYYCREAHTSGGTTEPGFGTDWQTNWYGLAGTVYEIPTPYRTADLDAIAYVQSGNVITLVHPDYPVRTLTRTSQTNWALAIVNFGPSIAAPAHVSATAGSAGARRYWAVTAVKEATLEESLAGLYDAVNVVPSSATPTAITWDTVAGAISYNVYRSTDGQTYGLINSAGGLPAAQTDTTWGVATATASSMTAGAWTLSGDILLNALAAITAVNRAYNALYLVAITTSLTNSGGSPVTGLGRLKIYYARDGEAPVLAVTDDHFSLTGDGTVTEAPNYSVAVPDNGYAALEFTITVEAQAGSNTDLTEFQVDGVSVDWSGSATLGFSDDGTAPDFSIGPPATPSLFSAVDQYPSAVMDYQQRRVYAATRSEPEKAWASRIASPTNFARSTPLQPDDPVTFTLVGRQVNAIKHMLDLGKLVLFGSSRELVINGDDAGILRPDAVNPQKLAANGSGGLAPLEVDDTAVYLQGRGSRVRDLKPLGLDGYTGTDLTVFARHLFAGMTIVDWAYQLNPDSVIWAVRSDGVLLGLTYMRDQAVWGWHRHDTDGTVERVCVIPEGDVDAVYLLVARSVNGATVRYIERLTARFFTAAADAFFVDAGVSYDGRNAGATMMTLSGGAAWLSTELLTVTRSAGSFTADNVGDAVVFTAADGRRLELRLEEYVSPTVMKGHTSRDAPADLQAIATTTWTLAVSKMSGLAHLEGKTLSALGDGFVVASPNNSTYALRTVSGGILPLGAPYGVVHAGLPYISDLETLDLDSPGPRTIKDKKQIVNQVGLFVEASRGVWAGRPDKVTATAPLAGLQERKSRSTESYDSPPDALTGYFAVAIDGTWDNNGGILVRQVDPLPLTVLAAITIGNLSGA